MSASSVSAALADGAVLIDVRPVDQFAHSHVRGAISIPLRPIFATWLGWLAPPDRPLIIVRYPGQDPTEIAWQAAKIGYDTIAGELSGGMHAWTSAGYEVARIPLIRADQLDGYRVLDIRQDAEYHTGHIPGAYHAELGHVTQRALDISRQRTVVMCGHGERAMGAASLLETAGHRDLAVLDGGPQDWIHVTGGCLETGA